MHGQFLWSINIDWLFAPITWDTTSWMLFLVSLALYEIMKIKVVISIRCLIRWNQRYSVICFMCDATLAAKVLETLRWKTSHTDGQNTGCSWKHGIHTLYANFLESSSPWSHQWGCSVRRHLCLSSPLIGGSLQVPGVILCCRLWGCFFRSGTSSQWRIVSRKRLRGWNTCCGSRLSVRGCKFDPPLWSVDWAQLSHDSITQVGR